MNWEKILKLKIWTPVSELGLGELEPILDEIYEVDENIYVRIQPFNENLELGDPRSPFVTRAYWSSSLDGLKKIILGDAEIKIGDSSLRPPSEISLGTSGLYSELAKISSYSGNKVIEKAEYSNKGKFLKRSISIGRFEYCFASNKSKDERAFFIKVMLMK